MKHNCLIVGMIILVGLTSARIYAEESPWPMFRHDLKHTGHTPYTGPATPTVAWTFPANDGITSSPSMGHDGTIYVGAGGYYDRFGYNTGGGDSSLYAINPDGTLKWQFKTDYGAYSAGIFSSPAIGPDGAIYFGALDHYVYALEDSTTYGKLKWKVRLDENPVYSSPALGYDGTVYVGSLDFRLYALNPQGTIKWNYGTTWCIFSSPAIGSDGTVYVGSKNHLLYVLEDSVTYGKLRWWYITGQFYDGHLVDSSPAIGPDGTIYFGSLNRGMYAVSPAGETETLTRRPPGQHIDIHLCQKIFHTGFVDRPDVLTEALRAGEVPIEGRARLRHDFDVSLHRKPRHPKAFGHTATTGERRQYGGATVSCPRDRTPGHRGGVVDRCRSTRTGTTARSLPGGRVRALTLGCFQRGEGREDCSLNRWLRICLVEFPRGDDC